MPVAGFPILGWISLCAYLAIFPAVWTWLVARFKWESSNWSGRFLWSLTGAAAWVALEFLRGWLFTGFPWNDLGVSQFKLTPLIQIAAVTGVYGVSFLVAWFSLALFSAVQMVLKNPARRFVWQAEMALPMCAVVFCYLAGFCAMNSGTPAENRNLHVTLVQPSEPQTLIWSSKEDSMRFARLLAQSQAALTNHADLLLWPESAVPPMDDATYQAINQFVRSNRVWLILNADDVEFHPNTTNYFNAAFLISPDGRWRQTYHKRRLVIFGEYVPLADWLPFLKWLTPISGGWTPGNTVVQFEINHPTESSPQVISIVGTNETTATPNHPTVKVSPLICFEDVFPGLGRDSAQDDTDLLVNLTNDGWFGESAEQWQHAASAVFRAVENGLPLIRCANNGVTCLIDARGRVQQFFADQAGDVHSRGTLTLEIPLATSRTPTYYHRHGDWFAWSCVGLTTISLLSWLKRRSIP